jgi:hypothetical protein
MPYIIRKKEGTKNIIILKFVALYYWLLWPTIVLTLVSWQIHGAVMTAIVVICWVILIGMAIPYWPTVFKLKRMMKEKSITAKGSKYSFTNPLTYEWED